MTAIRTREDIVEEYNKARAAYLKALDAQSGSVSHGGGGHSFSRAGVEVLREQMLALEKELQDFDAGKLDKRRIRARGATPVD